jgi:mRNA-degrading endonuclease RelE of RelBE toxin-antitoxin system
MNSRATPKFWKCYDRLPRRAQRYAQKAYQLWKANPNHPSLHFKRVDEDEPVYSVRVAEGYRVLGLLEGDTVTWYWIGRHDEYERLLM